MSNPILYFDHNATTRLAPEALAAMLPWLQDGFGNAGSAHPLGLLADGAVAHARTQVAALLGCGPAELVFNSGGTEGLNHVFRGLFEALPSKRHFVISAVEHPAVLAIAQWLRAQGAEVSILPVDGDGALKLDEVDSVLRPDTALLSVMAANNETGVRLPIDALGRIARAKGVLFHTDATQAVGKVPLDLASLPVDLLNLSAHKFHGPKGAGALFIRRGLRLKPFMLGGSQERGRRGGTENVPGLVGLGAAAELAKTRLPGMDRIEALRDRLERELAAEVPDLRIAGAGSSRLPNTSLLCFAGLEGEALMQRLGERGICVSTGSACSTGQKEPSHVLRAMGLPDAFGRGTIRISLGHGTTEEELAELSRVLPGMVQALRSQSVFGR
jgi:cysteine desulfurase